jgi:hypothetical protein
VSEFDNAEPLVTLALGDLSLIPSAFADVLDAMASLEPGLNPNGQGDIIDRIIDELTTEGMEAIKSIAALVTLRQAATGHQTFTEWLGTKGARRISHAHSIALLMDNDGDWPRDAHTYAEFRNYITEHIPHAFEIFDRAWGYYRSLVLAPYGHAGTVRTDIQYAARIAWNSGHDEIHPKTVDGTTRFDAERHAKIYNEDANISARCRDKETAPGSAGAASVVRRTVVYGPWYVV